MSVQLALRPAETLGDIYVDARPLTGPGIPIDSVSVRWVANVVVTSSATRLRKN